MTKPKRRWFSVGMAAAFGLGMGGTAAAQQPKVATVERAADPSGGPLRLSFTLAPMPVGQLQISQGAFPDQTGAAFALALAPAIDYSFSRFLYVGFAPQYIFNVARTNLEGDAARELDLRIRLGAMAQVREHLRLFAHAAPGYSVVMLPSPSSLGAADNPKGLVLGFAAGAMVDLSRAVFLSAEAGYQLGFQGYTSFGSSYDFHTRFLHVGLGLGLRI
jgi:hypothetical protein